MNQFILVAWQKILESEKVVGIFLDAAFPHPNTAYGPEYPECTCLLKRVRQL